MRAIVNKYAKPCLTCQTFVVIGDGVSVQVDDRWSTYCREHAPMQPSFGRRDAGKPADPTIELRWVDGAVQIRPVDYLGGDLFQTYLTACGGAEYKKAIRANVAGPELVGAIVTRLAQVGFKLDVDPQVTAAVQAWEARATADATAAAGRAAEVDAALRERGLALFPFQAEGVNWLAPRDRAILADDQGLGKTIQTLTSLPARAPVLVVCPAVAKGVWMRECARWRPEMRVSVLSGRGSFRWPTAGELLVTNYDVLSDLDLMTAESRKLCEKSIKEYRSNAQDGALSEERRAELIADRENALAEDERRRAFIAAAPAGMVVIADEAQAVKGKATGNKPVQRCARFKAVCDAAFDVAKGRVWLLTGTPLENKPPELWNLLGLIRAQRIVFGTYNRFKSLCGGNGGKFGTSWSAAGIDDSVGGKLREVMLRRMKADVLPQLPAKIIEIVDVELDAKSIERLDAIKAELAAKGIDLAEALKAAAQNRSIAFDEISRARKILAIAKTAAAMDMASELNEAGLPVLVFSAHRDPIDVVSAREGWAAITGDTPNAERTKIEERCQAGELNGIGATIKAAGVAITLTRIADAIFVDSEWNPAKNVQAEDRIYRIGQANTVTIRYLRANHEIDERVFELCEIKRGMFKRTVDAAAHREGPLATRANAADALESARASQDAAQRQIDAAEMADKVRKARALAEAGAVRRKAAVKAERANANRGWRIDPALFETPARPAQTAREEWAVQALSLLCSRDGDYAHEENGVGFNQADTFVGHALAPAAVAGQLNTGEWLAAIELLRKYQGQCGEMPE